MSESKDDLFGMSNEDLLKSLVGSLTGIINDEEPKYKLNADQVKAQNYIKSFLKNDNQNKFLLLGPAGTGKTSTIINTFNNSEYKIAFCAFTNKATQVLKNAGKKFQVNFTATFNTIHTLLALEPIYGNDYDELKFNFDKNKIADLKNYNVIIFDECSTISKDLYKYINEAYDYIKFQFGVSLKYIFLGDYWQLPPVGEPTSIIFDSSIKEKWPVSKLTTIMRSNNNLMDRVNQSLLEYVNVFRSPKENQQLYDNFIRDYPYNILDKKDFDIYLKSNEEIIDKYISVWKEEKQSDVVILTYSKSNCIKTNKAIQNKIDQRAGLEVEDEPDYDSKKRYVEETIMFKVGDRCCLERPIEIKKVVKKSTDEFKEYIDESVSKTESKNTYYARLDKSTGVYIYNGEIFDIVAVENILCKTPLNRYLDVEYFDGQILTITRINDSSEIYEILYVPNATVRKYIPKVRNRIKNRDMYLLLMKEYFAHYAYLNYGYCLTIYKSQGSEWHTTIVNTKSIRYCVAKDTYDTTNNKQLFKSTYTALTRSTNALYVY